MSRTPQANFKIIGRTCKLYPLLVGEYFLFFTNPKKNWIKLVQETTNANKSCECRLRSCLEAQAATTTIRTRGSQIYIINNEKQ